MNILNKIIEQKKAEIKTLDYKASNDKSFNTKSLVNALSKGRISIIAEIKFKSPSTGKIMDAKNIIDIAKSYEKSGASALSILTDRTFFDGNIRFIPREWPILNSTSVFAAKAAIASIKQDKYKDFHWKLMEEKRLNEDKVISIADELDIDLIELEEGMNSEFVKNHIEKSALLARKIGFSGTPLFIIEDNFVPGYVPIEEMKAIINKIRQTK